MRRIVAVLLAVAVFCLPGVGQVRLLIVDQTETVEESLRLEALARGLKATQLFEVRAVLQWPTEEWEGEPFHLVLVLPPTGSRAWLCAPGPVEYLPEGLQQAQHGLVQGVVQAFDGERTVAGMSDDLYPWFLAAHLAHLGYLVVGRR